MKSELLQKIMPAFSSLKPVKRTDYLDLTEYIIRILANCLDKQSRLQDPVFGYPESLQAQLADLRFAACIVYLNQKGRCWDLFFSAEKIISRTFAEFDDITHKSTACHFYLRELANIILFYRKTGKMIPDVWLEKFEKK